MGQAFNALGINIPSLVSQFVNFGVVVLVMYLVAWPRIGRGLEERSRRIEESLAAAERVKEEARQSEADIQARLDQARQDGQALVAQAQQIAQRIQDEGRAQAGRDAEALLERARTEIRLERDGAIAQLRGEFADIAVQAASKIVRKELDPQTHRQIIEETLAEARFDSSN